MLSTSWTHPTPGAKNEFKFAALPQDLLDMSQELEELGGGDTQVLKVESVCRVCPYRPPVSPDAKFIPSRDIVTVDGTSIIVEDPRSRDTASAKSSSRTYRLSSALPCTAGQVDVYDTVGSKALNMLWDGFNSVIMAAGAVGTGKSHTLFAPHLEYTDEEGIIWRVLNNLFRRIESSGSSAHYIVGLSCFEVCDKEIVDLMQMQTEGISASNPNKFVTVRVTDAHVASEALHAAWRQSVSWTSGLRNDAPSFLPNRGHTFVRITLYDANLKRLSTMHLVDLAGSQALSTIQRSTADTAAIARQQERRMINQHLLSLSRVISELAMIDEGGNRYSVGRPTTNAKATSARESKLTQLLGPLIAGNAKTFFIATVSPHPDSYMDTVNTLRIASRAMSIQTACMRTMNVDMKDLGFLPSEHVLSMDQVRDQISGDRADRASRAKAVAEAKKKAAGAKAAREKLDLNKTRGGSERKNNARSPARTRSTSPQRKSASSSPSRRAPMDVVDSEGRPEWNPSVRIERKDNTSPSQRSGSPRRSKSPARRGASGGGDGGLVSPSSTPRPIVKHRVKDMVDRMARELDDPAIEDLHDPTTQRINMLARNDDSVHALHRRALQLAEEAMNDHDHDHDAIPGDTSVARPYEMPAGHDPVNATIDSIVEDLETSRLRRLEKILAMTPHPHEKKHRERPRSLSPTNRSPISREMKQMASSLRSRAEQQHRAIDSERSRTRELRHEIMHVMANLSPTGGADAFAARNADDSGTDSVVHVSPGHHRTSRTLSPTRSPLRSQSATIPVSPPQRKQQPVYRSPERSHSATSPPRHSSPHARGTGTPRKSALSASRDYSKLDDIERLRENYETLLGVLRHEQEEKEKLEDQVKNLQLSLSERRTLRDVELESLRIENVEMRAKLRQLESDSPDFQELFEQYEDDVAKLSKECMALRRENLRIVKEHVDRPSPPPEAHPVTGAVARSEVERREFAKLQKEVVALRKTNHELMASERQRMLTAKTLEHSKRRFDHLHKDLKEKTNALKASQHQRLHLEAQLEHINQENTRLRNIDDALRQHVDDIMTETKVLHKAFKKFTKDHERQTQLQNTRRQRQGATGLARNRGAGGSQRPSEILRVLRRHVEGNDVKAATLCSKLEKLLQTQDKDYQSMLTRENDLLDLLTEDHRKVAAIETALFQRIDAINASVQELKS